MSLPRPGCSLTTYLGNSVIPRCSVRQRVPKQNVSYSTLQWLAQGHYHPVIGKALQRDESECQSRGQLSAECTLMGMPRGIDQGVNVTEQALYTVKRTAYLL